MKDFHIHYHLDQCASREMTMENIEKACLEFGITEAAVIKHYSEKLPNGETDWAAWHVQGKTELDEFLAEYRKYIPKQVLFHSGVETELLNDRGDINIPLSEQEKVDMIQLSIHFMIDTEKLPMNLIMYPDAYFSPAFETANGKKKWKEWCERVDSVGAEYLIEATVKGYYNAINRFPKIKSLAHINDGVSHLYTYGVDVDSVPLSKRIEIFEPLMKLTAEKGIFWEMTEKGMSRKLFDRGRELGVEFTCTADAHQLYEGWGPLSKHLKAEEVLSELMNKK